MMDDNSEWIIFDGKLQPADEPVALPTSRGLMYGEGIFETFRIYKGQTLFFDLHLERLKGGAEMLGFASEQIPDSAKLKMQIRQLLKKNSLLQGDAIVRCQCWQDGSRGYRPTPGGRLHYIITASRCPDFSDHHPLLKTVSIPRIPSAALPSSGKFCNGINYIMAAKEAAQQNADDVLMCTINGWVSETTIANIFWVHDEQIYTPSEACDLLPGITRQALIEIITHHPHFELYEGTYGIEDIHSAQAVAMCNSVRELLPVQKIDDYRYETAHPVLQELQQGYTAFRDQHLKTLPNRR